jgi:hypothetical protein
MTLRTSFLLTFIVTCLTTFGQCIDREKIAYGGDWGFVNFIHRCPTYNFAFGGDTSKNWNVLTDPIDILQAPKEVLSLKQKVESKIREFAGQDFCSKLNFNSIEVVYPEMLQTFRDNGRQDVTLKYCKARYFFYYEFKPDTLATYHIGIALDNKGNIISKFNFPSKEDYQAIDTSFSYCRIVDIARRTQKGIDPIKEVKLEFDDKTKRFYWLVTQALVDTKQGLNYFHQVFIDAADLSKVKTSKGSVSVVY